MGKLVLHIGLPKTATTSMQYQVLDTPENRSLYLGKFQSSKSNFHELVSNYLNEKIELGAAREEVSKIMSRFQICVYSNEMLTVDSGTRWHEKLEKLGTLLENVEVQILVTTRLPSSHAPSLYAELQPLFDWRSMDQFLEDNQSEILNIDSIDSAIKDSGLAKNHAVKYIDFDDLIESNFYALTDIVHELNIPRSTSHLNRRKYNATTIDSRKIGVYDLAYKFSRKMNVRSIIPKALYHTIGKLLRRIPFNWQKPINIASHHEKLRMLDEVYLASISKFDFVGKGT